MYDYEEDGWDEYYERKGAEEDGRDLWRSKRVHVGGPYVPAGGYYENYEKCAVCEDEDEPGTVTCEDCDGKGEYSDGEKCEECEGKGKRVCPNCDGDPELEWLS
jgi:hypothetical protein